MITEQRLRDDLHQVDGMPGLVPPENLADTVLTGVRRQRRTTATLVGAVAIVAVLSIAIPVALYGGGGGGPAVRPGGVYPSSTDPGAPAEPVFPTPGGGPNVIHVYAVDSFSVSYLLDEKTGGYRKLPYEIALSPDLKTVAVSDGTRAGIADRAELATDGPEAVRWLEQPERPYSGISWAPDGKAVAFTAIHKGSRGVTFTAYRYELKTRKVTTTPVGQIVGSRVGWTADSRRYIVLRDPAKGPLEVVNLDGSTYGKLEAKQDDGTSRPVAPGLVGGAESYHPKRTFVIVDSSWLDTGKPPALSAVLDVESLLPAGPRLVAGHPVGWYDDQRLVTYRVNEAAPGLTFEVRYLEADRDARLVPAPGLQAATRIQIGSAKNLAEPAEKLGF
ncbi:MAG: hypothetical protein ACRDT6_03350 [Micromonosporaceae bacterium]